VVAFLRKSSSGQAVVFIMNATPVVRGGYRLGVPKPGFYTEILNTDAGIYGGGNVGNFGGMSSEPVPWQGRDHSIQIELPPLALLGFAVE
jgi:1,4-alpha-glucan branching enzyme